MGNYRKEITDYLLATSMVHSRLGTLAAANPRAIARIMDGTAQVRTLDQVLAYIRAHPAAEHKEGHDGKKAEAAEKTRS